MRVAGHNSLGCQGGEGYNLLPSTSTGPSPRSLATCEQFLPSRNQRHARRLAVPHREIGQAHFASRRRRLRVGRTRLVASWDRPNLHNHIGEFARPSMDTSDLSILRVPPSAARGSGTRRRAASSPLRFPASAPSHGPFETCCSACRSTSVRFRACGSGGRGPASARRSCRAANVRPTSAASRARLQTCRGRLSRGSLTVPPTSLKSSIASSTIRRRPRPRRR